MLKSVKGQISKVTGGVEIWMVNEAIFAATKKVFILVLWTDYGLSGFREALKKGSIDHW